MLDAPYRQIVIMGVVAAVLSLLGLFARTTPVRQDGWRRLDPSAMHWFGLVLGSILLVIFIYVRLFVGSARADAERQMLILTGLIAACGAGVLMLGLSILRTRKLRFEWRGDSFAFHRNGQREVRGFAELSAVVSSWKGWVMLAFRDGGSIKLDEQARGVPQLLDHIAERRPDLVEGEEDDE